MKIAVCVKQIPVVSMLKFNNETKRLEREGVPSELNPFDVLATSLSVTLKQSHDAEVVVYTMGPPQARDALIQCLAMGADRGIHLTDMAFAGSDTLATARALTLALQKENYDLIICGRNSVDAETGQVGPEIAELLGLPQVTGVRRFELSEDESEFAAERLTDGGHDVVSCPLPALITVTEEVAPEIYPRRAEREAAQSKSIQELTAADLSDDPSSFGLEGSPTWVNEIYSIESDRDQIIVDDKPTDEAVQELMKYLDKRGVFDEGSSSQEQASTPRGPVRERGEISSIWVVAEIFGGEVRPVTLELLGRACELASELDTNVEAILIGYKVKEYASTLAAYGADIVHVADHANLAGYDTELYTSVLVKVIESEQPYAVLIPSTINGRDLASRVAGRLSLGLTGDCVGLELDDKKRLVQLKPAFGGSIVAPILSNTLPQMATVRPGLLSAVQPDNSIEAKVSKIDTSEIGQPRVKILQSVVDDSAEGAELEHANTIVCFGKGLEEPENMGIIRELADTLGAAIGTTRDVTELGWLPRQYQVGLSGKSVSPNLYIGIALSGVFNHTVGIQKSGTIVAINQSARAPIFRAADFGIVGEYAEVVPALIEALKQRTST